MAHWITSKLKVAENLLQQIDQQAAESLGKGETKQSDGLDANTSEKSSGTVPLRDQLKKKAFYDVEKNSSSDHITKVSNLKSGNLNLKDSDWTELLNDTPKRPVARRTPLRKVGVKGGILGSKVNGNGNGKGKLPPNGHGNSEKGIEAVGGGDRDWDGDSTLGGLEKVDVDNEEEDGRDAMGGGDQDEDASLNLHKSIFKADSLFLGNSEGVSDDGKSAARIRDDAKSVADICDDGIIGTSTLGLSSQDLKSASRSGSGHESDSDSTSTSDSGDEREREEKMQRRRQILATKAAAKALEAIKGQENVVARLEGEKQSLEKILKEQANQAAQEAMELQSMMMEMMEAAELEKQKHNHTRMEILAQLAKLETTNANLAKSFGTAQWNLEIEVNRLAELRHQVTLKEASLEELNRNIFSAHQTRATFSSLIGSKGFELQKDMLDAECAFATDKTARLQEKVMKLEADIDMALKEIGNSTEVEVELRRRLCQMTDHLIQKQAQVESLCSNKATLLFRIEAVSRLLDENTSETNGIDFSDSSRAELEAGTWKSTGSKLRPMLENKVISGRQHLGSLLRQLDAIFSAGAVFLSRNPAAKLWSLVYLVSLHLWVLYILFSHSESTEEITSRSVVSLENINGSMGV